MNIYRATQYRASKISDRVWGIFYTDALGYSREHRFAKRFTTKRAATKAAAEYTWAENQLSNPVVIGPSVGFADELTERIRNRP